MSDEFHPRLLLILGSLTCTMIGRVPIGMYIKVSLVYSSSPVALILNFKMLDIGMEN